MIIIINHLNIISTDHVQMDVWPSTGTWVTYWWRQHRRKLTTSSPTQKPPIANSFTTGGPSAFSSPPMLLALLAWSRSCVDSSYCSELVCTIPSPEYRISQLSSTSYGSYILLLSQPPILWCSSSLRWRWYRWCIDDYTLTVTYV